MLDVVDCLAVIGRSEPHGAAAPTSYRGMPGMATPFENYSHHFASSHNASGELQGDFRAHVASSARHETMGRWHSRPHQGSKQPTSASESGRAFDLAGTE